MYFSSKKGKWYNWAVQVRPAYRYVGTIGLLCVLLSGWRLGLYAYLDQVITTDRAAITQMQQQLAQLAHAERVCDNLSCRLPQLKEKLACYNKKCCVPGFCQMQVNTVVDKAQKSGLQLTSYGKEQQTNRDWCTCDEVQFCFTGNMPQIIQFFSQLKKSNAMIECTGFSCERAENNSFNTSCKLAFISMPS